MRRGRDTENVKKKATLKDVAQLAGVSTATVTRVLRNEGYIAQRTRAAVEQAIQQTGYHINIVAQGLRTQTTKTIGHLLLESTPNLFFAGVALGAEQEAAQHGWNILTINVQGDPEKERLGVETLIQRRVDAIFFTTPASAENVQLALDAGIQVVQIERPLLPGTALVTVDNYVGALAAVEHLIALGHRRIAYIGEQQSSKPTYIYDVDHERFRGYCDALTKHALPFDSQLVALDAYYTSASNGAIEGYKHMQRLLALEPRPTAVFISSDIIATGSLQALYAARLRIPEDISVVGFDNTYGPYLTPPLTTVAQPMAEIGQAAVQIVLQQAPQPAGAANEPVQMRLQTHLITRASTRPISAANH